MDLKRKLARLSGVGPGGRPVAPVRPVEPPAPVEVAEAAPVHAGEEAERLERLRRGLSALSPRVAGAPVARQEPAAPGAGSGAQALPVQTPHGTVYVREQLLAAEHRHGTAEVRAALEAEPSVVAALALDPAMREVALPGMLLLDTETTGLAGGTGTLPFVVGLGWFEGERLRVVQLLLRRPGEEGPLLRFVAERLAQASCLVTYNGKTFDWPLLRSRFVMNRLGVPEARPHLDLLHCARRVYRHRTGGNKLVQLEEQVLGHRRVGDVPGEQIPELYFRYLRTGDAGLLSPVLEHNAHDMVLLAALLGVLARQFRAARAEDPRDGLGYAAVAARAGEGERALAFAQAAAEAEDPSVSVEALALAAEVARRKGDALAAREALVRAVRLARGARLPALHLALAKLYEHQLSQPARALEHARHTLAAEGAEAHRRRLLRLEERVARAGGDSATLPLRLGR